MVGWPGSWQAALSGNQPGRSPATTFTAPDWDQDPATKGTIRWWNWDQCCMNTTDGDTAAVQAYPDTVGVDPYSIGVNGTNSGLNDALIKKNNMWVTGIQPLGPFPRVQSRMKRSLI
jgi:hypothetical protein